MDLTDIDAGWDSLVAIFKMRLCVFPVTAVVLKLSVLIHLALKCIADIERFDFLAVISGEDLGKITLYKYKVCSKHFISGKPAYLYNIQPTPTGCPP